jgi:plasmid stabilization system protein ParE
MARVLRTHQAEIDLVEILIPLYERSAAAGDSLADRIEKRCERLARLPEVGSRCEDLAPRLRFSVIGKNAACHKDQHYSLRFLTPLFFWKTR